MITSPSFICSKQVSLLQLMLSNSTSSFSDSTELNKIFNQLGITVSDETLHCYITKVVAFLSDDNTKTSFVTSIDNVDKGNPHASPEFWKYKIWITWNMSTSSTA